MPTPDLFDFSTELDVSVGPSGLAPDLLKEILQKRASLVTKVLSGACKTMESYADAIGNLRAYDYVLDYPERKKHALEAQLGTPIEEDE